MFSHHGVKHHGVEYNSPCIKLSYAVEICVQLTAFLYIVKHKHKLVTVTVRVFLK